MEFQCRHASKEDAPQIAELVISAWRTAYAGIMPASFLQNLDSKKLAKKWLGNRSNTQFNLAITSGDRIVGTCNGGAPREPSPHSELLSELYAINIEPSFWGKGAGQFSIEAAKGAMLDHGSTSSMLWVISKNSRAMRFYQRNGWTPSGRQRQTSSLVGSSLEEVAWTTSLEARS